MKKLLILLLFISVQLFSQQVLTFEAANGATTWSENSLTWQFVGGTDQIQANINHAYSGIGYGRSSSDSNSKLTFEEPLNLQSIKVKYYGGMVFMPATLYAYDSLNNVISSTSITPSGTYQLITIDENNVSSISFDVPMDEMMDPMDPATVVPMPQDLYFDELVYTLGSVLSCGVPQQTQFSNGTSTSVQPRWLWESGKKYIVRHKSINQPTWILSDTLISTYDGIKNFTITNLEHDSTYQWQVKAICNDTLSSEFSNPFTWTTFCNNPSINYSSATNVLDSSATISWTDFGVPMSFDVRFRAEGSPTWSSTTVTDTSSYVLTGLLPLTQYEVQVASICTPSVSSGYSNSVSFTTTGAICQTTYATVDTTVTSFPYIAADGGYYYQAGSFSVTIPNVGGCDSVISINISLPTISQALIVDFEEVSGTTSWTEDGLTWQFVGGTDQIATGLYNNYSGSGYGSSSSSSGSKLTFEQALNLTSIQVQYGGGMMAMPAMLYGYDGLDTVIESMTIPPSGTYQNITLNWQGISSISFDIPMDEFNDPMMGPIPMPQDLYFDELVYSIGTPPLVCQVPTLGMPVDLASTDSSAILWWSGLDTNTQTLNLQYKESGTTNWTTLSIPDTTQFELSSLNASTTYQVQVEAVCTGNINSGYSGVESFTTLGATCLNTYVTIDSIVNSFPYIAPDGNYYSQAGTYSATISNAAGCDSVIAINLISISDNPNLIEFEETDGTTTWSEDGMNFSLNGNDLIIKSDSNSHQGNGYLEGKTGYYSRLEFNKTISITSLYAHLDDNGSDYPIWAELKGYDSLNNYIGFISINSGLGYSNYAVNWTKVKSIEFVVNASYSIVYDSLGNNIGATTGDAYLRVDNVAYNDNCETDTTFLTITQAGSYLAPDGNSYIESGQYISNLINENNCDSTIVIDLTVTQFDQANILDFEKDNGTVTWYEDSMAWQFINGTDEIRKNQFNAYSGSGYGKSSSGSNSKLTFEEPLSLQSIRVKYYGGMMMMPATLFAYDSLNNVIFSTSITPSGTYQLITIDENNVSSISFDVPMDEFNDPMMGPMPMPQDLYFDELVYSIGTPPIVCQVPTLGMPVDLARTDSSAILWWSATTNAESYSLEYREFSNSNWEVVAIGDTTQVEVFGLQASTQYEVRLRSVCAVGDTSIYSGIETFTTTGTICQTTYATVDTTVNSFPYIAADGGYYYQAGSFSVTIPNVGGCDSVISINISLPTISQALIVDFEEVIGTTIWTEDGLTWQFVGGTDQIGTGLYNNYSGSGYGSSSSSSGSKLTFEQALNLTSIQVQYGGGMVAMPAMLYGYDGLGTVIESMTIPPSGTYQNITLNWQGISSISFDVPMDEFNDPMMGPMPMHQDLYFDELVYTLGSVLLCGVPEQTQFSNGTSTSVQPYWLWENGKKYLVRHQGVNNGVWIYSDTLVSTYDGIKNYTITGLEHDSTYQWQVKAICNDTLSSEFSNPFTWTTFCNNPSINYSSATNVLDSSATISWTDFGVPMSFDVRFRAEGSPTWSSITVTDTSSYILTGLLPLTQYEVQVASICTPSVSSGYSNSVFFTTMGAICQTTYATVDTTVTSFPYIAADGGYYYQSGSFSVAIPNVGGCDSVISINISLPTISQALIVDFEEVSGTTSWTEDGLTWDFVGGSDATQTSLYNAFSGSGYGRSSSGSNSKLTFEEPLTLQSVRVLYYGGMSPMAATIHLYDSLNTIVNSVSINPNGNYQLLTLNQSNVSSISFDVPMGEMMDPIDPSTVVPMPQDLYFDELSFSFEEPAMCNSPSIIGTENITYNTANALWQSQLDKKYIVRYKSLSVVDWTISDTLSSGIDGDRTYHISGLNHNSSYEWQVKEICFDTLSSEFSSTNIFDTSCPLVSLDSIFANNITDSSVTISWTNFGVPLDFQIWVKPAGSTNSEIYYASDTSSIFVNNLSFSTEYEVQIESVCLPNLGLNFSPTFYFTTLSPAGCQDTFATIDSVITSIPFTAPDGSNYYQPGTYTSTITNFSGCDSIITINLTLPSIAQAMIVDFEEAGGTTSWSEDSLTWQFVGGSDQIETGLNNNYSGSGYGRTESGSNSKLVFEQPFSLTSIRVKHNYSIMPSPATIFGHDSLGNVVNSTLIEPTGSYQNVYLENWDEISSISFNVPYNEDIDPVTFEPMLFPAYLYFDELVYLEAVIDTIPPSITCSPVPPLCEGNTIPDYTAFVLVYDNIAIDSVYQLPTAGSLISNSSLVTVFAVDVNGNIDSCSFTVELLVPTTSSIVVSSCGTYFSPSGRLLETSGMYSDTLSNIAGCDSIIQIDLIVTELLSPTSIVQLDTFVCHPQKVRLVSSCPSGILEWHNSQMPIYGTSTSTFIGSTDTIEVNASYGQYTAVCTNDGTCYSSLRNFILQNVSSQSVSNPDVSFTTNKVVDNIPSYEHCRGSDDLYFSAGCSSGVLNWVGSEPIFDQNFRPDTVDTYSVFCLTSGGCSSDTLSYTWNFKEFAYPDEVPEIRYEENYACFSSITVSGTGCSSQQYFGVTYNGKDISNSWEWSEGNSTYIVLDSSGAVYFGCKDPVNSCIAEKLDTVFFDLDTFITISKPEIPITSTPYCNQYEFLEGLSIACSVGELKWESFNTTTSQLEYIPMYFGVDFNEGDTLNLVCQLGLCTSDTTSLVVDYTPNYDAPEILTESQVLCENNFTTLYTTSCPSPSQSAHWIVSQDGMLTNGYHYYSDTINVSLGLNSVVSLSCSFNGLPNACETEASIFTPIFGDADLIQNILVSDDTLCLGQTVTVDYSTSETLPTSNTFEVHLSDENGDFVNFRVVGQGNNPNQTAIDIQIPAELEASDAYRIRVVPSESNAGAGLYYCYISPTNLVVLGNNALSLFNKNAQNCLGSAIRLESSSRFFETFNITSGYTYFKDGVNVSSSNQSIRNREFSKQFGENRDVGDYIVTLNYSGCQLESDPVNLTFTENNSPPSISDTLISVLRGSDLAVDANCSSQQVYSENPFSFYASDPYLKYGDFSNMLYDNTYYVACKTGDCISDSRKVEIQIVDSSNAPSAPILSSLIDTVCFSNSGPFTITASGCVGTVIWAIDSLFEESFDTDTEAPYEFEAYGDLKVYAVCVENGLVSKGVGTYQAVVAGVFSSSLPKISPANFTGSYPTYHMDVSKNSNVKLTVEEYVITNNPPFGKFKYCTDGIINWFSADSSFATTGRSLQLTNVSADTTVLMSCLRGNDCDDGFKEINITLIPENYALVHPVQESYSICGSGNILLEATGCVPTNIKWYSDSLLQNYLGVGESFLTPFFTNQGSTDIMEEYYVVCDDGSSAISSKEVIVYISPSPSSPMASDYIVSCNSNYVIVPVPTGCSSGEEVVWYRAANNFHQVNEYVYNVAQLGIDYNDDFSNKSKVYNVACRNVLSGCESPIEEYSLLYDCTPPLPPTIELANEVTVSNDNKEENKEKDKPSTSSINEFCVGEAVNLNANNCLNGTVFWSDGFVGSERSYKVQDGYVKLLANCIADNFVKSDQSNSLEFQSKPTPSFTLLDSVYNTSFVDLTADSVLNDKQFPEGTILNYYSDQGFTNLLASPNNVTTSGIYFTRAVAPNNCAFSDDIIVVIDRCGKVINLTSPTDNHSSGIVTESSRESITAANKLLNSTRVNYKSEKSILLNQGFEVIPTAGGVILMEIGECEE